MRQSIDYLWNKKVFNAKKSNVTKFKAHTFRDGCISVFPGKSIIIRKKTADDCVCCYSLNASSKCTLKHTLKQISHDIIEFKSKVNFCLYCSRLSIDINKFLDYTMSVSAYNSIGKGPNATVEIEDLTKGKKVVLLETHTYINRLMTLSDV